VYQSLDLDFVVTFRRTTRDVGKILVPLGFGLRGQTFHHDVNRFTIDFPKGPLMVGADRIERWDTVRRNDETLNVLSRTDCVRDRLAAFYHWSDRSSLATACDVAARGDIDLEVIRAWSGRENASDKYAEFERVRALRRKPRRS